ncbi:MAG TPA: hypothetical protein PLF13_05510 [candidate division Zixibacteria bacterium]|nr:hypothetical protein [candidate division Zixibacteria bacterium]
MNETSRKKIVYVALGLAIIWGGYNIFYKKKQVTTPPVNPGLSMVEAATAAAATAGGIFYVANPDAYRDLSWGRDPFHSDYVVVNDSGTTLSPIIWRLSGIVYSPERPIAIINSKTVRVGDTIDKASVLEITPKEVTLQKDGRTFTLTVNRG